MTSYTTLSRDLVLVGGGHAHALMLRMWGMKPVHGVQVTLINPGPTAPYSGMLPGHIAGHYTRDDLEIDLVKLARFAGARVIFGAADGIDATRKVIHVTGRGEVAYDLASLDVGLHAQAPHIPGFAAYGIGAKPLDRYADRWAAYVLDVTVGAKKGQVAVIGGGVAGCELALAMAYKLKGLGRQSCVTLIEGQTKLASAIPGADRILREEMLGMGVTVVSAVAVDAVTQDAVLLKGRSSVPSEFTVGAAGGFAHAWLSASDLPKDQGGFVQVNDQLLVAGQEDLFAVGDCAALTESPRPKAGVFAVRAAPVLYSNICATLTGGILKKFQPQTDYLKLMSLGRKDAMAAKWGRCLASPKARLWQWKNSIDQTFMRKFSELPVMKPVKVDGPVALGSDDEQMLCGGCGAKVAPGQLSAALAEMPALQREDVLQGAGDDAAVLDIGGQKQVMSVDHLRGFVMDYGLMGRIAAVHALGDVWAMGAKPQSALLSVTLPRLTPAMQARAMREMLDGVGKVVRGAGAEIVGGHSAMGAELTIGLTVTGLMDGNAITLAGAKVGDALILTRPLGSGTLLAAEMQGKADGRDVAALYEIMAHPQGDAAEILKGAHAMTDVTGFGLAGHLMVMCRASGVAAEVCLADVPAYAGAEALADAGYRSTIYEDNRSAAPVFGPDSAKMALLHDPQTSGGFLAAVAAEEAVALAAQLRAAGHDAAVIGDVRAGEPSITLS
ncbi:selenide, water dikinase SelD [Shimia sagamensis]|uniref:Selenophosphate synthase n=1 Tax=Shimia sagamensis TaxID=1566352 RepID=A0ABY1PFI3_9RHOB|nr:selenide, water dikinase SelD [Shimia sagamensis]SMP32304.1 selenophosphate synthase [Shimia sagamensis]